MSIYHHRDHHVYILLLLLWSSQLILQSTNNLWTTPSVATSNSNAKQLDKVLVLHCNCFSIMFSQCQGMPLFFFLFFFFFCIFDCFRHFSHYKLSIAHLYDWKEKSKLLKEISHLICSWILFLLMVMSIQNMFQKKYEVFIFYFWYGKTMKL